MNTRKNLTIAAIVIAAIGAIWIAVSTYMGIMGPAWETQERIDRIENP